MDLGMSDLLYQLIEALREELQQYGEMLARLEHQEEVVIQRQGATLLQSVASMDAQAKVLRVARNEREQRRLDLARSLGLREAVGFRELTARLPPAYRPLLTALVEENNALLLRIQQRARQNHLLLNRAVELMQLFTNTLIPGVGPGLHTETDRPANSNPDSCSVDEALV
jgi:hypothetical protein